ncbi:MAG: DUF47 family protein [Chitinophagales bacterium]
MFDKILTFFVPKNKIFFTLFTRSAQNLEATAKVFNELANTINPVRRVELVKQINDLEHVGDDITHEIFIELSRNFITPFDREDIHALASALDDIVDYIHGSAKRLALYRIDESSQAMKQLAQILEDQAKEIVVAVTNMTSLDTTVRIREAIVRLNSLENHADDVFDGAIAELFETEKDAVQVMKLKEILSNMETATDKCEDVANVIESIIVKNS